MPQTDTRSLQQIKRETEQTRAGLTDIVEQLRTSVAETASDIRQRISPDAIKAEVSDYIKSRGERLLKRRYCRRPQESDAGRGGRSKRRISTAAAGANYTLAGADGGRGPVLRRLQDRADCKAEGIRSSVRPFG